MQNLFNFLIVTSMAFSLNGQITNVNLNLQSSKSFNGPENIGIGMVKK